LVYVKHHFLYFVIEFKFSNCINMSHCFLLKEPNETCCPKRLPH